MISYETISPPKKMSNYKNRPTCKFGIWIEKRNPKNHNNKTGLSNVLTRSLA